MDKKLRVRQWIKNCMRKILLPVMYRIYCVKEGPVNKNLVIFADAHHREFPEDMSLVKESIEKRGYQTIELVQDFSELGVGAGMREMIRFMKYYAKAGYVFLCDYYLPVISVKKREQTKVIQLWHACGAYKKFGYDAREDLVSMTEKNLFRNFDLTAVSAEACRKIYAQAFHVPKERVQALGVSRTDRYFSKKYMEECRTEFFAQYPEAVGKKIILWAPTFRKNAGEAEVEGADEIEKLSHRLGSEWYVIKKVHPHSEKKICLSNCRIPTERLYAAADLLITDYSSVIFDFALTRKPILIYAPDRDAYEHERGFYLKLEEFPAKIVTDMEKLTEIITKEKYEISQERYDRFLEEQMEMCDGRATERIVDYVLQM